MIEISIALFVNMVDFSDLSLAYIVLIAYLFEIFWVETDWNRKLLPGVEGFAKELRQKAQYPRVSQKNVKLLDEGQLGFVLLVLNLQLAQGDYFGYHVGAYAIIFQQVLQ